MKAILHAILTAIISFVLVGCISTSATRISVDEVPMYGGMDRKSNERLRKGDEDFIKSTSGAFGGRKNASRQWADTAFRYFAQGKEGLSMRRFNQAWLLDANNPECYWGFGLYYRNIGDLDSCKKMYNKAYNLGLREDDFLRERSRAEAHLKRY